MIIIFLSTIEIAFKMFNAQMHSTMNACMICETIELFVARLMCASQMQTYAYGFVNIFPNWHYIHKSRTLMWVRLPVANKWQPYQKYHLNSFVIRIATFSMITLWFCI